MRIYNITTESKFTGMYISEDDCANFIYNVCLHANMHNMAQIAMISNYARHVLQDLFEKQDNVVFTLATVQHGNKNCVRLSAMCAILGKILNLDDNVTMTIAHKLTEEWEDVEIEVGGN